MANDLSGRQWRLDTPIPFGSGGAVIFQSEVKIENIEFTGYAAQGNLCIIKNRNGKIVWQASGAADLTEVRSAKVGWVDGLIADTIQGGGICIVYTA